MFINGGVGSNGNITLRNNSEVCGAATPGPGHTLTLANSATVCPGYPTTPATTSFALAPVDQGTLRTQNDNSRICAADTCTGSVAWTPSTRTLDLTNSGTSPSAATCTASATDLRNTSQLRIAPRTTPLRIYFDSPEACGGTNGWSSIEDG